MAEKCAELRRMARLGERVVDVKVRAALGVLDVAGERKHVDVGVVTRPRVGGALVALRLLRRRVAAEEHQRLLGRDPALGHEADDGERLERDEGADEGMAARDALVAVLVEQRVDRLAAEAQREGGRAVSRRVVR